MAGGMETTTKTTGYWVIGLWVNNEIPHQVRDDTALDCHRAKALRNDNL